MYARALFSDHVFHDPLLLISLVLVVAGAPLVWGGTLTWVRRNRGAVHGFRAAIAFSGLAALPALALAVELVARVVVARASDSCGTPSWDWGTTAWARAWCFLGPCLFLGSIGERYLRPTPKGLSLLQASHVLLWLAGSQLAFLLTAPV
jgi:hypothetical protein